MTKLHSHLLRHLSDARKLRHNELVAHLFVPLAEGEARASADLHTLELIRRTLEDACTQWTAARVGRSQSHAARQAQILRSCDFGGELHTVVARRLGLSMRQFYRERGAAIDGIVGLAAERFAVMVAATTPVADEFSLEIARLRTMQLAGLHDAGVARAATLAAKAPDESRRTEAVALAARMLADEGSVDKAGKMLDDLRLGADTTARAQALFWLAKAELHEKLGQVDGLRIAIKEAIVAGRQLEGFRASPERDDLLVRIGMGHARKLLSEYDARSAATVLAGVERLLRTSRRPPAHLMVEYQLALGEAGIVSGDLALVSSAAGSALEIAKSHGYVCGAFAALTRFVYIALQRGDVRRAFALLEESVRVSRGAPPYFGAIAHLIWASVLAGVCGSGRETIEHARAAREVLPTSECCDWAVSLAMEAKGLELEGEYEQAISVGEEASRLQRSSGDQRYLGSTLRVIAESYERLQRRPEAIRTIEEAVHLLSSYGHPMALHQTYSIASRITGDRRFMQAARDLVAIKVPSR